MILLQLDFGDTSNIQRISPLKEFDLNGLIISMRLYYNMIDNCLYMNMYDKNDKVISNGIKLVPNVNFISKINYKFDRDFELVIKSTNNKNEFSDVTIENFGKDMVMIYAEDVESN